MQEKQTKRSASEPESEVRRGVTVVGDSLKRETEFISHRLGVRESMAGRSSLCQTGGEGSLVS